MSVSPPSRACLKRCARASKERPIRRRSRRRPSPTDWPACRCSMRSGVRPRRTARWSASILDAMSQTNSPAPAISPLLTLDVEVEWLRNLAGTPLGERVIFGVRGGRFDGPHLRGHVLSWGGDSVMRTASATQLDVRLLLEPDDGVPLHWIGRASCRDRVWQYV